MRRWRFASDLNSESESQVKFVDAVIHYWKTSMGVLD